MGDTTRDTKTRNVKIHDNFSAEECFRYKCSVQWLWCFTCLHWPAGRDHVLTIEYSSEFLKKFSIKWEDKSSNPIWLKIDLIPPQQDFIFFLMFFWVSLKFRLWTMRAYICAIDIILPQPVGHYGDTWNVKMIESP